ncbi:glutamate dehydrogenase [Desulforhopalus singaporensis]|uniref:Glutamate dehydrogenase n=2 Tax=Desulforhopalus singaporensis TaxID=91360 RepID=A0A1H0KF67_9BACT|nr:glutamate dehydrogenase [Desulforhopalus singaporensis]
MKSTTNLDSLSSGRLTEPTNSSEIIQMAEDAGLDSRLLYEAVIDLSGNGLLTANCINFAAGILLKDLGLPGYFFEHITKQELTHLLQSIALSIRVVDGKAALFGRVAHIDFNLSYGEGGQRVRIATEETRDSMEAMLEEQITGRRRDYYYSPENKYYTYIIRSGTVKDFDPKKFDESPFLFSLVGTESEMPQPTRKRYQSFLRAAKKEVIPLIQVYNLPETGETRLMFNSDFELPRLPILRKILEDLGFELVRAYWEPYLSMEGVTSSVCSLYIRGEITRKEENAITRNLRDFLSFSQSSVAKLYLNGAIDFKEMLFAGNCIDFAHLFIFNETENPTDHQILNHLVNKDHQDAFAKRVQDSNKSTYGYDIIESAVKKNPDLIRDLYAMFAARFDPAGRTHPSETELEEQWQKFDKKIRGRFIDFAIGYNIFRFIFKMVSCTLKTNFYCENKRSFSFRFDNRILDPLVFSQPVYGIFFVNGHYSRGTHMRAGDIARGGLRLIRVTRSNHESELAGAVLLNYALGPKAQRIKHKDICESGSKGVVVPHPGYARCSREAMFDYTEGIMDLIQVDEKCVIDYYGMPEMIFFGPDEGTAQHMDMIALRAKERNYAHWRTLTTGKSFGIPHDTYGMLDSGDCFGLFDQTDKGVELQIEGKSRVISTDTGKIYDEIGESIALSGMTTSSIMSTFRALIDHYGAREEELNLMITGGPDGDLGANEIQCYKGKICLLIDGGSILFDPEGLDKKELRKLAFARHTNPRLNSLAYPDDKLGAKGFKVPLGATNLTLFDGTVIDDGSLFHRNFLTSKQNRKYLEMADIKAFIPCGGFKDTINHSNVQQFVANFQELQFIVEGANVFFDDSARRHIATDTTIKQIKDSSANKGGVFSSSIAEVLTAFILGDQYESKLEGDLSTKWGLVKNILTLVEQLARQETKMLVKLYEQTPDIPLFDYSQRSSEQIFALQETLEQQIDSLIANDEMVDYVLTQYVPHILIDKIGLDSIKEILNHQELHTYRNTILTKKTASLAFYKFGTQWDDFIKKLDKNFDKTLKSVIGN